MRWSLHILVAAVLSCLSAFAGAQRVAPAQALPAVPFAVTNSTSFATPVAVHAVEEELPAGWTASNISHAGRFDAASRRIKWGPFFDGASRNLSAIVTATEAGTYPLQGTISIDGATSAIAGPDSIRILTTSEANRADAALPQFYSAGIAFDFSITVKPAINTAGYAIEDTLPEGWTAFAFNEGGAQVGSKIKWGPFFDHTQRELRCSILPPANATAAIIFNGIAGFDGIEVPIGGARQVEPILSRVEQTLPLFYDPNVAFTAQLAITPAPNVGIFSIQSTLPQNWIPSAISDGGSFDSTLHAVKWGPFFDATTRTLTFQILPPSNADLPATIATEGAFDAHRALSTGARFVFPKTGSAFRALPTRASLLETLFLTNQVTPKPGVITWAAQDLIPSNWTVSNISDGGFFDPNTRLVKWGPFFDDTPRALTCSITTGILPGINTFSGLVSFDGAQLPIVGAITIIVEAPPAILSVVVRNLPNLLRPGSSFVLSNRVAPADIISVHAVQEQIPANWTVSDISDGGAYDAANRLVKWGPFFDATPRILTCRLTAATNAAGTIAFAGHGSFDGQNFSTSGDQTLSISTVPNRAPIAAHDTFTRLLDRPLLLTVVKIFANDSDPDGDLLTISIPLTTAKGIPISLATGGITYAPAAGFNESDTFIYTIRDTDGASATATVTIQPPPPGYHQNVISIEFSGDAALIRFSGIPLFAYDVQIATDLAPPNWSTAVRRTASSTGRFEYLDTAALSTPQRYYRTLAVE